MVRALTVLGAIILMLMPLYIRVQYSSSEALQEARVAKSEGRIPEAIESYRKAASWRAPFSSAADKALGELLNLSRSLENSDLKLEGYRKLRSAIFNSRSFLNYSPESESHSAFAASVISEADSEIDRLARNGEPQTIQVQPTGKVDYNFQILSQFAFWGWLASVFYFIFSAFDADGHLKGGKSLLKSLPIAASYTLWIVALLYA